MIQQGNKEEGPEVRSAIEAFLAERRDTKLKALQKDYEKKLDGVAAEDIARPSEVELEFQEKTADLEARFTLRSWVADAAERARQISFATHPLKFTHPDAKGTSIYKLPSSDAPMDVVATAPNSREDVVGNAAALDVYKFLSIEVGGRTIFARVLEGDRALFEALGADDEALAWMECFRQVASASAQLRSHTLAKQVYWPLSGGGYHLLAILFPSSLVQQAYEKIRDDRFSERTTAAREAQKKGLSHEHGFRDFPALLTQHYGGTKPQNISQLNSSRHGENWLLSSCPPAWQSREIRLPLYTETIFGRPLIRRRFVREQISSLIRFLEKAGDHTNKAIRDTRGDYVSAIFNDILTWAEQLRARSGWSRDPNCRLHEAELCWLDPTRAAEDDLPSWQDGSWRKTVAHRLANWFNQNLTTSSLPMAEEEYEEWKREFKELLRYE